MEIRAAERGGKRRILELAERNARLALDQDKLKAERRRQQRVEALDGLQAALGLDALPVRIECFDISNLGGTHTSPRWSSSRAARRRSPTTGASRSATRRGSDDFAAMDEVLSRRPAAVGRQPEISPYDRDRDASFAALPNLIVIDGGPGQLAAGLRPLQDFRDAAS